MTNQAFILLLQQGQPGAGGFIMGILPFILIFGVFYFLIIMPQRRRQRELQDLISKLKAGDRIVTSGGIIGTVKSVRDRTLVVMSDKSMLEISRSAVAGLQSEEEKA
ncbi:MAG TPA: preprotein translocase subunit YajC [Pyrinomonadaceae bacterium]|nr:preprotein translocase subunit YajC [Pyrinomonadaceae bacterium]